MTCLEHHTRRQSCQDETSRERGCSSSRGRAESAQRDPSLAKRYTIVAGSAAERAALYRESGDKQRLKRGWNALS